MWHGCSTKHLCHLQPRTKDDASLRSLQKTRLPFVRTATRPLWPLPEGVRDASRSPCHTTPQRLCGKAEETSTNLPLRYSPCNGENLQATHGTCCASSYWRLCAG